MCLLVVGIFSIAAKPNTLILSAILLLLGFSFGQVHRLRPTGLILLRLKWLFLSILLIYLFLTPGTAIPWLPHATMQGLEQGSLRIVALVLFIAAVNLLIRSAEQAELAFAILWLLRPLRWLHFPVNKFAVRLVLTLDYVSSLHKVLRQQPPLGGPADSQGGNGFVQRSYRFVNFAADRAAYLYHQVLAQAEHNQQVFIDQPQQTQPRHRQWLAPLFLVLMYLYVDLAAGR